MVFQVIDKNEDDTKAASVFGFKVGKQWFYAPVFFMNGELKGYELLYMKNQDTFVPLQENWVNYLINRKPVELGEKLLHTQSRNRAFTSLTCGSSGNLRCPMERPEVSSPGIGLAAMCSV